MPMHAETIAAISTPPGEGGIAVIRVSGEDAVQLVSRIFRFKGNLMEVASHTVHYGHIIHPDSSEAIDEVLVIVMRAPRTFTGEDVTEIHCHGGMYITQLVLETVLRSGARLAEPGEFTKRAFLNGRIDLMQAESVIDLIRSKSDRAHKSALKQLDGRFSDQVKSFRAELLRLLAHVEVNIDYPEHDTEMMTQQDVIRDCDRWIRVLDEWVRSSRQGRMIREGVQTVLAGKPNVGKSSLMNMLLKQERAIVTDIAGTTRDVIEEWIQVRGYALRLFDTAGIRETSDVVEQIGVKRTKLALDDADLVLFVLNANENVSLDEQEVIRQFSSRPMIFIVNKSDLVDHADFFELRDTYPDVPVVMVSALTGSGISQLEETIVSVITAGDIQADDQAILNRARHIELTTQARNCLSDARFAAEQGIPVDLIQIDLRLAWETLGLLIGDTAADSLLDELFSQFCLGK